MSRASPAASALSTIGGAPAQAAARASQRREGSSGANRDASSRAPLATVYGLGQRATTPLLPYARTDASSPALLRAFTMWDWETAARSCSTITVREGTTTVTALTPSIGFRSRSTSATSAEQHTPSTSRYVFSHLPLFAPPAPASALLAGGGGSSLSSTLPIAAAAPVLARIKDCSCRNARGGGKVNRRT
uniref:Uncharacterized protein n=1 Tax=Zea mays TaxID=4577 RepID=C4J4U6_MAIZE|nr:unknown [Zea mays]